MIEVHLPLSLLPRLLEIARVEGIEVSDVLREAVVSYITAWETAHDEGKLAAYFDKLLNEEEEGSRETV